MRERTLGAGGLRRALIYLRRATAVLNGKWGRTNRHVSSYLPELLHSFFLDIIEPQQVVSCEHGYDFVARVQLKVHDVFVMLVLEEAAKRILGQTFHIS